MCSQKQSDHVLSTAPRATFCTAKLGTHPAAPTVAPTPTEESILWLLRLKKWEEEGRGQLRGQTNLWQICVCVCVCVKLEGILT